MNNWDWLDYKYFSEEQFAQYTWLNKGYLYMAVIVPLLFLLSWLIFMRFKPKFNLILPSKKHGNSAVTYLRHIPSLFFFIFVELVIIGLARPQKITETIMNSEEGIDIILAIDISQSMGGMDLMPNRLEAAKSVAKSFVANRKNDRIGIVVFSGEAFTLCPLTTDYTILDRMISQIDFKMIQTDGTAIGTAIACATNRMRYIYGAKSKVLILLTDGENNAGQLPPLTAVELSRSFGIKTYTIAVGKNGNVKYRDENGGEYYVENQLDESTLREIAQKGRGHFDRATSNENLVKTFKNIDLLEKSITKSTKHIDTTDYYDVYLMWALVAFLIWLALKSSFMNNIMVD